MQIEEAGEEDALYPNEEKPQGMECDNVDDGWVRRKNSKKLQIAALVALAACLAIGFGIGFGVNWDDDNNTFQRPTTNVTSEVILSMDNVMVSRAASNMTQVLFAVIQAVSVSVTATCKQICQGSQCYDCNGVPVASTMRTAATLSATPPTDLYFMVTGMVSTPEVLQNLRDHARQFEVLLWGTLSSVRSVPTTSLKKEYPLPFGTAMAWGPDGRMYVVNAFGVLTALQYNMTSLEVVNSTELATIPTQLTGITVHPESTADNIVLYMSGFGYAPILNTGFVWKLSGSGSSFSEPVVVISGLPRSNGNLPHGVSGIHFGANNILYISSGGLTAAGAELYQNPSFSSGEVPLSTAILTADVDSTDFRGVCYEAGTDPYAEPNCTLGIHATGFRNAYDFVIHSNGKMYATDNGHQDDGAYPTSGTAPCMGYGDPKNNPGDQPDLLLNVMEGKYYGHPNPTRGECAYRNGSLQDVPAPQNYEPPLANLGMRASANGITEYTNEACPSLHKHLLLVRFSTGDDVMDVELSADGTSVVTLTRLLTGLVDPLSVSEKDGNIFVTTNEVLVAYRLTC
eukprot:TRINITY_DN464_c1_g4_i1.p1 TRINITY_DN464_c1_g4~~TRINITY_DN464_c1_g4_i1.p1  ORF type:complete len:570 (+),score=145.71 TRINITY_DN464_c1_g4_i1:60-1769(+)